MWIFRVLANNIVGHWCSGASVVYCSWSFYLTVNSLKDGRRRDHLQRQFRGGNLGCFPLRQRFQKFGSEFKWKSPFPFLLTGIFGITSGGGPLISVAIFRPKFAVPFFFALIREFGKGI